MDSIESKISKYSDINKQITKRKLIHVWAFEDQAGPTSPQGDRNFNARTIFFDFKNAGR